MSCYPWLTHNFILSRCFLQTTFLGDHHWKSQLNPSLTLFFVSKTTNSALSRRSLSSQSAYDHGHDPALSEKGACPELRDFRTFSQHWINGPRPLSRSTIKIHFVISHFGSLKFPLLSLPETLLPGVHDLLMGVLPHINGCESLWLFGLQKFQTSLLHFIPECFHLKLMILRRVSFGINGRYVLQPSGLREFSTQHNLSNLSPLECPISGLHDLSPCGEILEVEKWPSQAGATCHVLTNFSTLQILKTY
jgi:hypothetical protein